MQNRNFKTKSIVEAGLNAAIVAILMLFNSYVPAFVMIGSFLLPIPITLLYVRNNMKVAVSAVFVSAVLASLATSPINAFSVAVTYGLTGITLGYCIKKNIKYSHTIGFLSIASFIGSMVTYIVMAYLISKLGIVGLVKQTVDMFQETKQTTEKLYLSMGMTKEQIEPALKIMDMFTVELVLTILPAVLLLASIVSAYFNYAVTKLILKRLKYQMKDPKPFSEMYVDNRVGAVIIAAAFLGVILNTRNMILGQYITNSAIVILQMIFTLDGSAVLAYFLKKRFNVKKGFLLIILLFLVFSPQFNPMLLIVGFADLIFDFRKLDPNRLFKRDRDTKNKLQ